MVVNKFYEELFNKVNHYLVKYPYSQKYVSLKIIFFLIKNLFHRKYRSSFKDKETHICITLYGRIGDFVIAIRYVKALSDYLNKKIFIRIDDKYKDVISNLLYGCYFAEFAENKKYDIEISICRFPKLIFIDKKRKLDSKCLDYCNRLENFFRKFYVCYENDYLGYSLCKIRHIHRIDQADFDLLLNLKNTFYKINLKLDANDVLKKFNLIKDCYITVQTGSGNLSNNSYDDVRQIPNDKYHNIIGKYLKNDYCQVVQLGVLGQPILNFVDKNLLGKTSFAEMLCILKNSKLHIQQEGGLVHLRHFLSEKKSVVIFGPTDPEFYSYKENIIEKIVRCENCCCEWMIPSWMNNCLLNSFNQNCKNLSRNRT